MRELNWRGKRGSDEIQSDLSQRFGPEGDERDVPTDTLSLPEGLVEDAEVVERAPPPSLHVEGRMEEDDDFLAYGTEVWEYDVAEGREEEFQHALLNSGVVLEYEKIEDELIG